MHGIMRTLAFAGRSRGIPVNSAAPAAEQLRGNFSSDIPVAEDLAELPQLGRLRRLVPFLREEQVGAWAAQNVVECGEQMVNLGDVMRKHGLPVVISPNRRDYRGEIYLRSTVAKRLAAATCALLREKPPARFRRNGHDFLYGMCFKVYEGYRPERFQREEFKEAMMAAGTQLGRPAYADEKPDKEVYELATQWSADPDLCPPHSTGAALDLTLVRFYSRINPNTGRPCPLYPPHEVNMGCAVNDYENPASRTWSDKLEGFHIKSRITAYRALLFAGFSLYPGEFWHVAYQDPEACMRTGKETCPYGSAYGKENELGLPEWLIAPEG